MKQLMTTKKKLNKIKLKIDTADAILGLLFIGSLFFGNLGN